MRFADDMFAAANSAAATSAAATSAAATSAAAASAAAPSAAARSLRNSRFSDLATFNAEIIRSFGSLAILRTEEVGYFSFFHRGLGILQPLIGPLGRAHTLTVQPELTL